MANGRRWENGGLVERTRGELNVGEAQARRRLGVFAARPVRGRGRGEVKLI